MDFWQQIEGAENWQKDMRSVVGKKRATSVPAEAALSEWSGVASPDLAPFRRRGSPSAYSEHMPCLVMLPNTWVTEATVVSFPCHAQLLHGCDMETESGLESPGRFKSDYPLTLICLKVPAVSPPPPLRSVDLSSLAFNCICLQRYFIGNKFFMHK